MQMSSLLDAEELAFGDELTLNAADSSYSKAAYLSPLRKHGNHVELNRSASNRKFYYPPTKEQCAHGGRSTWYGDIFRLPDEWLPL